jgi:voltage-gated potassium channel
MNDSSLWIILQRMRLPFVVIVVSYAIAMTGLIIIPGVDDSGNPYHLSIFEAFYIVTYTATTIGYGEIPYAFTHAQKIWVSMSIYLTVLGWFYGIGALVSLLQDKLFISEIAIARFQRTVRNLKDDFIIVLGYNETTIEIIKRLLEAKMRVVVIEKSNEKAEYLMLEGFTPYVPVLVKDAHNPKSLEMAGINSIYCKGIISLFEDSLLNLRVSLASKILNPRLNVAVKSTTDEQTGNLLDVGADIVENPFEIIAYQIQMALKAPSLFKLENWLYKTDTLEAKSFSIPDEDIIICGFGRLGSVIYKMFINNNITPSVIEKDETIVEFAKHNGIDNIIVGNAEDKYFLNKAGIDKAKIIFVVTDNDTTNLSIVSTVKKLNKDTVVITRENELSDFSIFSHANIDHIFLPEKILIHKTTNAIINPLNDKMIELITQKDEIWGQKLLARLVKSIGVDPITIELNITKNDACEIYDYVKQNSLTLDIIRKSRRDRTQSNNIVPLLVIREDDYILLPDWSFEIEVDDKILLACDDNAKEDLEYIANNMYEFRYIVDGFERKAIFRK